jgi:aldehyde dehydrogenase (NAD+)
MSEELTELITEARSTGRLAGLPKDLFIDGDRADSSSGDRMPSFDPGTGQVFADFASGNADDVDRAVASSQAAFEKWRNVAPAERASLMMRAAMLIRENSARLSVVESMDSGKSVAEAQGDIAGCARLMEYYAGATDKLQGDTIPLGPNYLSYTQLEPVGVTAHIIPWNYPSSTMIRGIAPALAAG